MLCIGYSLAGEQSLELVGSLFQSGVNEPHTKYRGRLQCGDDTLSVGDVWMILKNVVAATTAQSQHRPMYMNAPPRMYAWLQTKFGRVDNDFQKP